MIMKLSPDLEQYIGSHINAEDPLLTELDRETHFRVINYRMLSGHLQGSFYSLLVKLTRPSRILEIGTLTGYSAICLARGLTNEGRLITLEIDDELEEISRRYFKKAGLDDKITLITGNALDIIPALEGPFDLVLIDAHKPEYTDYYQLVFDKVSPGGLIIADNTLWGGKVTDSNALQDEQTRGIIRFNEMVMNDNRVEKVILPFRDGITLIRKKENPGSV